MDKLNYFKIQNFSSSQDTSKKIRTTEWDKIFVVFKKEMWKLYEDLL